MSARRTGVYGGTFDPIHLGHMEIARAVVERFRLDELLLVPAFKPPHKQARAVSQPFHRFALSAIASMDDPRIRVSTIELEMPERPYSFQTVERLRDSGCRDAKLYFVIGADSFAEIMTWREPERLLSNVDVIVAARPGIEVETSHLPEKFRSKIRNLERQSNVFDEEDRLIYLTSYVERDISSREIRRRVREGISIRDAVPERVADYIEKYGLYRQE
jgi:nicotinate-nucleotide adenylyltransferase